MLARFIQFFLLGAILVSTASVYAAEEGDKERLKYYAIRPAFVTNLKSPPNRPVFLQIKVDLMTYETSTIDAVKEHMPQIRHRLLMVFSEKTPDELRSREGAEQLKVTTLEQIQQILEQEGSDGSVEQVLFTEMLIQ